MVSRVYEITYYKEHAEPELKTGIWRCLNVQSRFGRNGGPCLESLSYAGFCIICIHAGSKPVWFTLTETEVFVNGKILIPLLETEKFETETVKFGYVRFCFRCISVSRHVTWYGSTNSLWSKCLQCTNKTACTPLPIMRSSIKQTVDFREK